MVMGVKCQALNSGHKLDRALQFLGRVSVFLAPLTVLSAVTVVMVYHGKSVLYALWCAVVACVPVFVLLGVHLLGMMCKRVAEPRTPVGIAVFITFQGLWYGAMFLLALPWYFVLVPVYLLSRFVAGKVRERRAQRRARPAPQSVAGP